MAKVASALGLSQIKITPKEIYNQVVNNKQSYDLTGGISIRRSFAMGEYRIEVAGTISPALSSQLTAAGCFTEMVQWRNRVFIPASEGNAIPVIERVTDILRVN